MKRILLVIFILFLSSPTLLQAQVDCEEFPLHPDCQDGDPDAPIDSGVGLLIGAAALYTVKRLRDKKEKIDDTPKVVEFERGAEFLL